MKDAAFFDSLSTPEIRRRQDLVKAQFERAHKMPDGPEKERAYEELGRMDDALMEAMLRRC